MSKVLEALARHAAERPHATALVGEGRAITYAQLERKVRRTAEWLEERLSDAAPGAPVAIALDNGPAWVVLDLALIRLGRPSLPLPPFFTPDQVQHALRDAGACAILRPPAGALDPAAEIAGAPVAARRLGLLPRPLHAGTAKITYTSGSTGRPKGVCLSQAQLEAVAASIVEVIGAPFADRHMAVLPLGVLLENVAGLYPVLLAGGCYQALPLAEIGFAPGQRPDIGRLIDVVERDGVTSLILVPELLRGLVLWLGFSGRRLPNLRLVAVGGARVSSKLIAGARAVGVPAYEGYGLSECGSVVALNTPWADRTGTAGRVLPHLEVRLEADGELVAGPRPFLGYVGGPRQDGPVHTGDLCTMDADGYVSVVGRKSNVLITSFGRNVSPEWVESELLAQPEIAQSIVFGDGAPELCALLVPSTPAVTPDDLEAAVARANAALPSYARIGRWRLRPPLDPLADEVTANGRPRRATLRETHRDFIEAES
ncbi:AMP-binding protein [Phenylobacterium soli]|uniref:AMP-dependent synthetase n=1 Tax=Phenylobacterium soli TaxID=2170551 RepID=A0A328AIZ0_9CAUL|nr:AMP-binding protein [Phenylobacterium soli]RAK54802.1 AMP-dependent synthetase [Phenylobacterium soli]